VGFAAHVGKREIGRFEGGQALPLIGAQAEVPGGKSLIVGEGLLDKLSKGGEVEPGRRLLLAQELLLARFGERKAQPALADSLGLQLEARGAVKIGGRDPELPCFFVRGAGLGCFIIVDDRCADFSTNRKMPVQVALALTIAIAASKTFEVTFEFVLL
jgi:hypothetical protein